VLGTCLIHQQRNSFLAETLNVVAVFSQVFSTFHNSLEWLNIFRPIFVQVFVILLQSKGEQNSIIFNTAMSVFLRLFAENKEFTISLFNDISTRQAQDQLLGSLNPAKTHPYPMIVEFLLATKPEEIKYINHLNLIGYVLAEFLPVPEFTQISPKIIVLCVSIQMEIDERIKMREAVSSKKEPFLFSGCPAYRNKYNLDKTDPLFKEDKEVVHLLKKFEECVKKNESQAGFQEFLVQSVPKEYMEYLLTPDKNKKNRQ